MANSYSCLISLVERVDKMNQGMGRGKAISTAIIENLNLFLRESMQYLVKKS